MRNVTRRQVLGFRTRAQQLGRESGTIANTSILDIGVQDTGPDGGMWALALRGVDVAAVQGAELATLWTLRGAPHIYRRADIGGVAAAVAPMSDADAGKRIFDASKPLKAAEIGNLAALDYVAQHMRAIVKGPTVKGEMSTALALVVEEPYLRFCRPCNATHLYEQTFRLAALRAGLELQAGTSPPVLEPIRGFKPARRVPKKLDVVRGYLRFLGPATHKEVAAYIDAPLSDVRRHWPTDAVQLDLDGEARWLLESDVDDLDVGKVEMASLLGPFDLFLQARDRSVLVPDPKQRKVLWPVLGRPGALLVDGEIAGVWRPRKSGRKLSVQAQLWARDTKKLRSRVQGGAEELARYRQIELTTVDFLH